MPKKTETCSDKAIKSKLIILLLLSLFLGNSIHANIIFLAVQDTALWKISSHWNDFQGHPRSLLLEHDRYPICIS